MLYCVDIMHPIYIPTRRCDAFRAALAEAQAQLVTYVSVADAAIAATVAVLPSTYDFK